MKAKVVSVLLCMAMVTTLAVGCGSSSDSSDNTESTGSESTETEEEGVKQGGTIEFDPYNTKTSEGYRSPIIGLVHELAHTDDFIQGRMVPVDGKKLKQKDEFELLNKRIAEQYPLEMENKVRAKLKLPLRSSTFIFK